LIHSVERARSASWLLGASFSFDSFHPTEIIFFQNEKKSDDGVCNKPTATAGELDRSIRTSTGQCDVH
jgi:hypothetical protein